MLMLATSAGLLGDILGEAPSLASDADYQAIWEPFPDGMHPVIYIDFPGVLGSIREGMDSEARADFDEEIGTVLSPIQAFGMANQVRGNLQFATAILIIGEPGE